MARAERDLAAAVGALHHVEEAREAHDGRAAVLGAQHPITLRTLGELGQSLVALGELREGIVALGSLPSAG